MIRYIQTMKIIRVALYLPAICICLTGVAFSQENGLIPGSIFREYSFNKLLTPFRGEFAFNDSFFVDVNIDDLKKAVSAEIALSYWGGHSGTSDQTFEINRSEKLRICISVPRRKRQRRTSRRRRRRRPRRRAGGGRERGWYRDGSLSLCLSLSVCNYFFWARERERERSRRRRRGSAGAGAGAGRGRGTGAGERRTGAGGRGGGALGDRVRLCLKKRERERERDLKKKVTTTIFFPYMLNGKQSPPHSGHENHLAF